MSKTYAKWKTYAEWKLHIGSPRELFWELNRFLDKEGFESNNRFESLKLEPTPIEGHATFNSSVTSNKRILRSMRWMFILGVVFCFTIVLIPIGLWLIKTSAFEVTQEVKFHLEGETFRASARSQEPYKPQSEVTDSVSNVRLFLEGKIFRRRGDGREKPASESENQAFDTKLSRIEERLNKLIPNMRLPEVS